MAATAWSPEEENDVYTRRLIYAGDKSLVESRCSRCGALVYGSATESLIADEREHMKQCPNRPKQHKKLAAAYAGKLD